MKSPALQRMTEEDIPEFQGLLYELLDELHSEDHAALAAYREQFSLERLRVYLANPNAILLQMRDSDSIVATGVGWNKGGVGYLNWMGVRSRARRKGLATQMLFGLHEEFRNIGCWKGELCTYRGAAHLRKFYAKHGYREVADLQNHYFGLDIIYMVTDSL